jgi:hypothetical protein
MRSADIGALTARVLEYRVSPSSDDRHAAVRIVEECLRNGVPVILVNKLLPNLRSTP